MEFIIMAGTNYNPTGVTFEMPRQLAKIKGECLIERTIRLLREQGVTDIAISSENPIFEQFGVPVLKHNNTPDSWLNAFYPTDEPVCYLYGDVCYSPNAIKTIVETQTDDIEFFASAPPFAENYIKNHAEPLGYKVVNTEHFKQAIAETKDLFRKGILKREISWELWQVIKKTPLNTIIYTNYTAINDYSVDIDTPRELMKIEKYVEDR